MIVYYDELTKEKTLLGLDLSVTSSSIGSLPLSGDHVSYYTQVECEEYTVFSF